jgi:serine/threonine protein kinase
VFKFPWKSRRPKTGKPKGDTKIETTRSEFELDPAAIPLDIQTKHCPKCKRIFDARAVICHVDSTLLMLAKSADMILAKPITALRQDGTTFDVLCKRSIGKGSLCEVFDAEDTSNQQRYVVKLLLSNLVWDTKSAKRFVKGAEVALPLQHENIVRVHGTGTIKSPKDKSLPFIVCDYFEGRQLNELITKDCLPSVYQVLDIFEQVCFALEYAHSRQVIHGDLKPTNICLVEDGEKTIVKVADFAVAERLFRDLEWDKVSTMTTSIYGCSTYLSPDFMDVRMPTPTSDIYSVGCMMYECLTGAPPFTGANDFAIILAHRDTPPQPFSAEYTPKDVAELVMKALEKDPRKRCQCAAELRDAISGAKGALAASNAKLLTGETES